MNILKDNSSVKEKCLVIIKLEKIMIEIKMTLKLKCKIIYIFWRFGVFFYCILF